MNFIATLHKLQVKYKPNKQLFSQSKSIRAYRDFIDEQFKGHLGFGIFAAVILPIVDIVIDSQLPLHVTVVYISDCIILSTWMKHFISLQTQFNLFAMNMVRQRTRINQIYKTNRMRLKVSLRSHW